VPTPTVETTLKVRVLEVAAELGLNEASESPVQKIEEITKETQWVGIFQRLGLVPEDWLFCCRRAAARAFAYAREHPRISA